MEKPKYVDNDVFKYAVHLKNNLLYEIVSTKPFPEPSIVMSSTELCELNDYEENLVLEKYFTKEKIDELKQKFIKEIQESENPFDIYCVDRDGGYNLKEEELFNLD